MDLILNSNPIAIFVFIWLSIYFVLTIAISIYKYLSITALYLQEKRSLKSLMKNKMLTTKSILTSCDASSIYSVCRLETLKNSTSGLSFLSMISSTAPFIGLFGTIVSILETFKSLGSAKFVSLNLLAPSISEALVVTAVGIFVAIPAYSMHILLSRKINTYMSTIDQQIEILKTLKK
ncbi:MAG: MotA/TolQ/ExbB proton channel family protein [uncultured Campylobacterales bacterium]|uniref:MotA/TolQ/ExbB proton channel family protein n=1 Tax=uncultured Campylobacterales bacterium TaxID=352960 RepID=A0A6S6S8W2_9BACT|nr:MAG: MotA/TolQ/ExbB proton channel family protein [uncultured Campylobacterales bacterium]